MSTNVLSGARAIFFINGKRAAWASGVSVSEEIMFEPVDVLDNLEVAEHVPVGYRVTLSCEIFRTVAATPGATAPAGSTGSLKATGIFPKNIGTPNKILLTLPYTVVLKDRLSGATLLTLHSVKAASYNFSISPRGIVGQNVQFVVIRARDESGG